MKFIIYIFCIVTFISCKKEKVIAPSIVDEPYFLEIPNGFTAPTIPLENQLTKYRVKLGKKLFYDPVLSQTNTISCASCHIPANAFSDTMPRSIGVHGRKGMRNSPTLANIAYNEFFFMDGGVPTMELQVVAPIQDSNEMNLNILHAVEKIKYNAEYRNLSRLAYNREPDSYVITRAIASFERTLISGNSYYDRYLNGEINAMSASQVRGKNLFFSNRTNCSSCHAGFNFKNNTFQNIGLHQQYKDSGRMRVTVNEIDRNKFTVPTLRNIEVTYPYMHDGSIQTLGEVVNFLNTGGFPHANKSNFIQPLGLNNQEKEDLVNFLKALTDESFLNNKKFRK